MQTNSAESSGLYLDEILEEVDQPTPFMEQTLVDVIDRGESYSIRLCKKSGHCRPPTYPVYDFLKSDLTHDQIFRLKDEQIRLLTERVEQSEFDTLCYKLMYSSDDERVDLVLMQETDDTVTLDVKHDSSHYYGRTVQSRHTFHKSSLRQDQRYKLPTLEMKCKQRLLMIGEMCRANVEDYINRLLQDEASGNIKLMERIEDNETIWIQVEVHDKKKTRITLLTKSFRKNRLTSKQLELFRTIPLSENIHCNKITTGELWKECEPQQPE